MKQEELIELIRKIASSEGVDPDLAEAIAGVESNYNTYALRFEPSWKYFVTPKTYAKKLMISEATERMLQACSYSAMQIMGSVCRELGFQEELTKLVDPNLGVLYACKKLKAFLKKYPKEEDAISSYNQGNPRKDVNGLYVNQKYLDKVYSRLNKLRQKP